MRVVGLSAVLAGLALAVLAITPAGAAAVHPGTSATGAVFVLSNNATGNAVVAYDRNVSGGLTWIGNYSTGGTGTGASLASQGSLVLTPNHQWLLGVDAGSNQISVFWVQGGAAASFLVRTDVVSSGGVDPVSLALHGSWVYVLNDGSATTAGNIAGFHLSSTGMLAPIAGSTQPLSTSSPTGAAEIAFNPIGHLLVVTEKATQQIDVYNVNPRGVASAPTNTTSNGNTPYGFAFTPRGQVLVSEAASGSLSSYSVHTWSSLSVLSASVTDGGAAPCWVAITANGHYAFTTNGHSNSISSYVVHTGGRIVLLQSLAGSTSAGPNDLSFAGQDQFLYVFAAGGQSV
ncbi:MAG: lactonase family protein, partial [Thermoplasmata archaeon]|nr:lactonase family protein [Thermoplasmata archaeon]